MNEKDMNKPIATNLERFDAMTDDMIDTSDIPPLSDKFFEKATWQIPTSPIEVMIEVDPNILAWFKSQGDDYQKRVSAALRIYAEARKSFAQTSSD